MIRAIVAAAAVTLALLGGESQPVYAQADHAGHGDHGGADTFGTVHFEIPGRFRSMAGAAAAAAAAGNAQVATARYRERLALAADAERPAIADARAYLGGTLR